MRKVVEIMNCEEFELRGLDLDRAEGDVQEVQAAAKHAEVCIKCRALLESWREVKSDLRILREATRLESAPTRVEMRLKQELRTRREARVPRGTVAIAGWALAAAAVLVGAVSWGTSRRTGHQELTRHEASATKQNSAFPEKDALAMERESPARGEPKKRSDRPKLAIVKEDDAGKFTLLPGSWPAETEETAVVRVRMQRGTLGALGLPVNQELAGEWIQVDLLVGNDGFPQAVRLAR